MRLLKIRVCSFETKLFIHLFASGGGTLCMRAHGICTQEDEKKIVEGQFGTKFF